MQIQDVKSFDQKLNLIFHAILAGPLLLYCYTYLESLDGSFEPAIQNAYNIKIIGAILSGLFISAAYFFYKIQIKKAREFPGLKEKLENLFKISMIQFAILEAGQFIAALGYFLTLEHVFTVVYVSSIFLMSVNRPSPKKYAQDLLLKGEERKIVLNKLPLTSTTEATGTAS